MLEQKQISLSDVLGILNCYVYCRQIPTKFTDTERKKVKFDLKHEEEYQW